MDESIIFPPPLRTTIQSLAIRQRLWVHSLQGGSCWGVACLRHSQAQHVGGTGGVWEVPSLLRGDLPRLLPSATCFPLLFMFLRHQANMKAARLACVSCEI